MAFKLKFYCEFCEHEIISTIEEIPSECPVCSNTGDTRDNKTKFNCPSCKYFDNMLRDCSISEFYVEDLLDCSLRLR